MNNELQMNYTTEQTYHSIRHSIVSAQRSLSVAVNSAMVTAYWEIGEQIYKACGENDRAGYGKKLLQYLSAHLTAEFGKGFDESNLRKMRQFYCAYPIRDTLCPELSWSHYRMLMRVDNERRRLWYMNEAADAGWSSRQLDRQIQTLYYDRLIATRGERKNARSPHGASGSLNGRSTRCTISASWQARINRLSLLRYKQRSRNRNMKKSSKTPM